MKRANVACVAALALGIAGCKDPSPNFAGVAAEPAHLSGRKAPHKLESGHGREISRFELARPLLRRLDRVSCPFGVHLGRGARFTCKYSDPALGTGAVIVRQVDDGPPRFRYRSAPISSVALAGEFRLRPG